jgi:colicin import membrane protein
MDTFMLRSRPQCPNCRAPVSRQHLIEGDNVAREHTFVHNVGAGGGRDSTTSAALGRQADLEAVSQLERQLDAMRLRAEEERLDADARAERARRVEEARLAILREEVRAAQAQRAALQAAQAEEERAGRRRAAEAAARAANSASSFFTQHDYQGQRSAAASSGYSTGLRHSSSGSANGRELMRGPRGGLYYVNSNGNKTYVRK